MNTTITKERIKKFMFYYKPHKRIFIIDMFCAAISATTVLLFPLVSGYITKEVLGQWNDNTQTALMTAGLVLLILLITRIISNIIYAYFGHAMGAKMEQSMRQELFDHYQKLSFSFHAHNSVGKLMTVISNDLAGMTELFHHGPEDILMTLIKFVGSFVILININIPLTAIVFLVLPVLCYFAVKADKVMERGLLTAKKNLSELNEQLEDDLSGIRTVKAFGNESYESQKFYKRNDRYTKSKCYFYKVEAYFYEVVEAYPQFLTMLTVFFGSLFIGQGTLDVPVMVTFLLYVGSLSEPIRTMLNFMRLYEEGKSGFIRYMNMLEIKPLVCQAENAVDIGYSNGAVSLANVSFRYDDGDHNIVEDLSIEIKSGESVAFVGVSGIGKTTISMLIARFYDVTGGAIKIDGVDIRNISIDSLRRNIGIVQQEVFIFNGTIKDNIRYGKQDATDEEIILAAKLANSADFINELSDGYDSIVGTHGITLSGGQRQRISLARVFLKNPPILILDEATSALDYESELLIQASLNRLMENRTCIVIAHRLSTIKNVDTIVVLEDKQIKEKGSHYELIQKNGEYARLYNLHDTSLLEDEAFV